MLFPLTPFPSLLNEYLSHRSGLKKKVRLILADTVHQVTLLLVNSLFLKRPQTQSMLYSYIHTDTGHGADG